MPRKNIEKATEPKKDTAIIVTRQYWVKPIAKVLPKEVMDEAFQMNRLWNRFVEISNENREAYQTFISSDADVKPLQEQFDILQSRMDEAYAELKKMRIKYRTKKPEGPLKEYTDRYRATVDEKKALWLILKEKKSEARGRMKDALYALTDEMKKKTVAAWKDAYQSRALYWANANAVSEAFWTSWRAGIKKNAMPKFHRFDGNARFCLQFIGGKRTSSFYNGKSKMLSIKSYDLSVYDDPELSQRKRKKLTRTTVTFFTGKVPVQFHIQLHRPIPEGNVKRAVLTRQKKGVNVEWRLSLTIELEKKEQHKLPQGDRKKAALDMGFRMIDGTMRLAVLFGNNGKEEIFLPEKILESSEYVKELQKERDALLEDIKEKVFEILPSDAPKELKAVWEKARQGRMMKILKYLKETEHFFVADMEKWNGKDKRLVTEMAGLRRRLQRHRKWYYSNIAHKLCEKYSRIAVEKLKISEMSKIEKAPGEPNPLINKARENSRIAAVGEFLSTLKYVAQKKETDIIEIEAAYTTMQCHVCKEVVEPNNRAKLRWECPHCKSVWDQDVNAAKNLYVAMLQPVADTNGETKRDRFAETAGKVL